LEVLVERLARLQLASKMKVCDSTQINQTEIRSQMPIIKESANNRNLDLPFYHSKEILNLECTSVYVGDFKLDVIISVPLVHRNIVYDLYQMYYPPAFDAESGKYFTFSNAKEYLLVQEKGILNSVRKFTTLTGEQMKVIKKLPRGNEYLYPGALATLHDLEKDTVQSPHSCTYYLRTSNSDKILETCNLEILNSVPVVRMVTPTVFAFGKFDREETGTLKCKEGNRIVNKRFVLEHRLIHINKYCYLRHSQFSLSMSGQINLIYKEDIEYNKYSKKIFDRFRRQLSEEQSDKANFEILWKEFGPKIVKLLKL